MRMASVKILALFAFMLVRATACGFVSMGAYILRLFIESTVSCTLATTCGIILVVKSVLDAVWNSREL
ncbi:hypothetical protein C8J57DRAFT_1386285, partial [Mycena rebaudengoi]